MDAQRLVAGPIADPRVRRVEGGLIDGGYTLFARNAIRCLLETECRL